MVALDGYAKGITHAGLLWGEVEDPVSGRPYLGGLRVGHRRPGPAFSPFCLSHHNGHRGCTRARSARTLREPRQASIRLGFATSSTLDRYAKSSSSTGPILVRPRRGPVKQVITGEVECAVRINDLGRSMAANLLGSTVGVAEGLADGSDVPPERRVGLREAWVWLHVLVPLLAMDCLGYWAPAVGANLTASRRTCVRRGQ
jgi:hypothetical protein